MASGADHPEIVETTMSVIDNSYDESYIDICSSSIVKIINFGENIHEQ
jgi:hypothetical protein